MLGVKDDRGDSLGLQQRADVFQFVPDSLLAGSFWSLVAGG